MQSVSDTGASVHVNFRFPICKMVLVRVPTWWGFCEDRVEECPESPSGMNIATVAYYAGSLCFQKVSAPYPVSSLCLQCLLECLAHSRCSVPEN